MKTTIPTFQQLIRNPIHLLAFGFGSGLLPKAPGTAGTVMGLLFWCLLAELPLTSYLATVTVAALAGVYICGKTASDLGVHDHGGIVWDEMVGLWLALAIIPVSWAWVLAGFLIFRLFDIWKPWPISWLDKNITGGLGIMLDDLVAGALTWLVLFLTIKIL
jgi:phosphatidylglycerophosphatase A